jgi:hypothetical protein
MYSFTVAADTSEETPCRRIAISTPPRISAHSSITPAVHIGKLIGTQRGNMSDF